MFNRISKRVFVILFFAMLIIPLATINLKRNTRSETENRKLAQFPDFYDEEGKRNINFNSQFETWVNDNIGFRSEMVATNAKLQYYLFRVLTHNDMYLGPNGEFNYATKEMLADYQHLNLKSEQELSYLAEGFQYAKDYLSDKDIQMYYFQCWDKHSIYPEYFPKTVIQYGEKSKTDQIVKALIEKTDVNVISPKAELIAGKDNYESYSKWGDSSHWTQRGAFVGYQKLMGEINNNNNGIYKMLQENDYNITVKDQGVILSGGIHKVCLLEKFEIKNPQAYLTNEKLMDFNFDQRHKFFTNDHVDNDTRILILGDSYFESFILDDIAESFYETLIIWGDYCGQFERIIDIYKPDIVIVENAERCDRVKMFADKAISMKQQDIIK